MKKVLRLSLLVMLSFAISQVGIKPAVASYDIEGRPLWPSIGTSSVGVLVLEYHCISNPPDGVRHPDMYVSEESYISQLELLKRMGLVGISLSQATSEVRSGNYNLSHVVFTFDDGYIDNKAAAMNLRTFGYTGTFFVITGLVGKSFAKDFVSHLSWEDIATIKSWGMEIGAHTVNHIDLSTASKQKIDYEIQQSIEDIKNKLDCNVDSFSLPLGAYTRDILIDLSFYGLTGCVTSNRGFMTGQTVMKAPRIKVEDDTDLCSVLATYLSTNLKMGEDLKPGDTHEHIRTYRTLLTRLGFPLIDSNEFDSLMETSVKRYQEMFDIEPSGVLNDVTIDCMVNDFMELNRK
ncbi:MAG TPA: polysaccharide deacetylase family protein [Caldisericia bacterium]|nr:polysaccharide deacetylase family protein [Caldisericia bacterium]HPF48759.1 polysaccharide deacetylase family protein [Caldisericia bacterium]HPI83581.1 polysaccharide deacetylase family protein [Caldisericia bacterium]HPQ93214.1 polysaccharide deacetylase family protein [Caldisericia bacterium]HRV74953.1 polysaccharide deacetylase family protein [Caldisericia bacterium]